MGGDDGKVIGLIGSTAYVRTVIAPVVGQHIAIWDPAKVVTINGITGAFGGFRQYVVTNVAGSASAWQIQVNGGFVVSPLNSYVSPDATRMLDYGLRIAQSIRALGPGEKTTSTDILPRGRRQPAIDVANPANLSSQVLSDLDGNFDEIEDVSWLARVDEGTSTPRTSPVVPATTSQPPEIITLAHAALRPTT
jgi:hypothetical protein